MALIDAVKDGSVPVVARILAGGADLDARDAEEFDETALMRAAGEGHVSMVKLLLEHSAQMESKNSIGCTALMHAAMQGHANVVSLLVKNGADTNATDFSLKTAADMALDHNHAMVFSILRPEAARQNGEELRRKFDDAQLVHVISTRYRKECGQADAIDPRRVAEELKRELEGGDLPSGPIESRGYSRGQAFPRGNTHSRGCVSSIRIATTPSSREVIPRRQMPSGCATGGTFSRWRARRVDVVY